MSPREFEPGLPLGPAPGLDPARRSMAADDPAERARDELVDLVLERIESPLDHWAVTATLESEGLRDVDARERFGVADMFELGEQIYERCHERLEREPPPAHESERELWFQRVLRGTGFYLRGTFFAVPMTIQLVALLALGYNVWVSLDFSNAQITVTAFVSILSFLGTDGFVQSIGRLGPQLAVQEKHLLARRVTLTILRVGVLGALAFGALAWLPQLFGDAFSDELVWTGLVYYVLLSLMWLCTALLYMLRQLPGIVLSGLGGVGAVVVAQEAASLGIYVSHWLGLGGASLVALAWALVVFRRRARATPGDMRHARLPRTRLLVRAVAPYFVYGIVYYAFLFTDRLVAWTAPRDDAAQYISFSTPYELGLDWALVSLVPTIALLEFTISRLSDFILDLQERTSGLDFREHNRRFLRFWRRHLIVVALLALAGAFAVDLLVEWAKRFDEDSGRLRDFFADSDTFDVHWWAVAGYSLVVLGLMNSLFLMALSRPWSVLSAFIPAVLVSAGVGIWLSRTYEYWYAVIGMAVGGLLFAVATTVLTIKMLRRADYHYYAAY